MNPNLDQAIAAAREALAKYWDGDEKSGIGAAVDDLLAALDAARGEAVAWRVWRGDSYELFFNEDAAKRRCQCFVQQRSPEPLYAAPPAAPRVERYGDGVLVHWPEGMEQYVCVGDCVTGNLGAMAVPAYYPLGETIYTPPSEEVRFCYSRGQPNNINASRLGEACRRAAEKPGGDYIDGGLSLLKELEARGYGVFRFAKSAHEQAQQPAAAVVSAGGVLSAVERAISKGYCPSAIEEAYEQYEAECIAMLAAANKENT